MRTWHGVHLLHAVGGLSNSSVNSSTDSAFEVSPYSNVQEGETLSAGITRTMTINFKPTEEISYQGTLTLETDSPDTPEIDFTLSGEGVYQCQICAPLLRVDGQNSPAKAEVYQVGSNFLWNNPNPSSKTITLENHGDEDLVITDIQISNDPDAPNYETQFGSFTNTCGTDGEFSLIGTNLPITIPPADQQTSLPGSATISVQYEYLGTEGECSDCYFTELLKDLLQLPFGGVSDDSLAGLGQTNFTMMEITSNDPNGTFKLFFGAEVGTVN